MKPLDDVTRWLKEATTPDVTDILPDFDQQEWSSLAVEERSKILENLLQKPVDNFSVMYRWYFRKKWFEALDSAGVAAPVTLLEIGAGDGDMLPNLLAKKFSHKDTRYLTANMNKQLTASLKAKTAGLPIQLSVIEDEARNICQYIENEKIDVIVFEHSVNDILQTILAEREGIDTTHENWWDILSKMIEIIKQEYLKNTLETSARDEFLGLIRSCLDILKPGGYIIINHFMYQYDLDLGYEPDLWNNMLPIARQWISRVEGAREVSFEGFDPQWWLFLQKNAAQS